MDFPYTIDDVARTSDDGAVRAEFSRRTLGAMRLLSVLMGVVSIPHAIAGLARWRTRNAILGVASVVLTVMLYRAVRKSATGRLSGYVRAHVRGVAIVFAWAWLACILGFHARAEGMVPMSMMVGMAVLAYRLLPAEHILLHIGMAAISALIAMFWPFEREPMAPVIAPIVAHGMFLGVALLISLRARRQILADWVERRASAREQIRMRDELQYARELQLAMLPERAPQLDWVDVAGTSVPATEVGGDYYDYFVEGNRLAMVCGDVAGHGLASGLVLASLRAGFTLLRDSLDRPSEVLRRLHDLIAHTSRRRMLATVAVVLLDRDQRRATIASAGHPPILVRRNGSIRTIELFAPPLGVRLPVEIPQLTLDLAPGDLFVLHSDGVYESRNPHDESYGLDRLAALVLAHPPDASAESLRDAIAHDVEAFRGGAAQDDDVTIVVGKVAGSW